MRTNAVKWTCVFLLVLGLSLNGGLVFAAQDSNPSGWGKGEKKGWTGSVPPGLEKDAKKKQEEVSREAAKKQEEAEKEAKKKQKELEKEAKKKQKELEKEAKKKQKELEKEAKKKQKEAEKQAEKAKKSLLN